MDAATVVRVGIEQATDGARFLAGFNERWTNVIFGKAEQTIAAALGPPSERRRRDDEDDED